MFRLETDRLIIRPWEATDRAVFLRIMRDPEVTRYIGRGKPFSEEDTDEFFARQSRQLESHSVCMGAAVERESGRVVGIAGVQPLGTTLDLEIGWIFHRDVWGRGFATEAGEAARDHVLRTLKLPRVVAIIDPDNEPSKRVAARLGMQYEDHYTGAQLGHRNPDISVDLYYRNRDS